MRIVHCNTTDSGGGAAIAAYRLHRELVRIGIDSNMAVQKKTRADNTVLGPDERYQDVVNWYRQKSERVLLKAIGYRDVNLWGTAWLPGASKIRIGNINPDLVHLHYIGGGFISIEQIGRIKRPIVWTLHDMWAFTGGCYHDGDCGKYKTQCTECPVLKSRHKKDLSTWTWNRKMKSWRSIDCTIVAPSRWLARCVMDSAVLGGKTTKVIPNGIDTNIYKPLEKRNIRKILGLPEKDKLLLFGSALGAEDEKKGYVYLKKAIGKLSVPTNIRLLVLGGAKKESETINGVRIDHIGRLTDDFSLAMFYSAADLLIAPSIQDNLPNMVMESLSCGTPVAAFKVGGMEDLVDHGVNGYLALKKDADDLRNGIEWILKDRNRYREMCVNAREKVVRNFNIEKTSGEYIALYEKILGNRKQKKEND